MLITLKKSLEDKFILKKIHFEFNFIKISFYKVEKLSKLKKIIMEKKKDSNMIPPIILPILLSMNGKQHPMVSFAVPMGFSILINLK